MCTESSTERTREWDNGDRLDRENAYTFKLKLIVRVQRTARANTNKAKLPIPVDLESNVSYRLNLLARSFTLSLSPSSLQLSLVHGYGFGYRLKAHTVGFHRCRFCGWFTSSFVFFQQWWANTLPSKYQWRRTILFLLLSSFYHSLMVYARAV